MKSAPRIKIGFISLGCAKNLVDSEVMLGSLLREGMELTMDNREADVVIINTCGFIEAAKQESIDAILRANDLRTTGRCRALIMAGCLTQRYPKDLQQELPEVDAVVGLNEVPEIGRIVRDVVARASRSWTGEATHGRDARAPKLYWSGPAQYIPDYNAPRFRLTPPHYAYVKIAEGCNHPCTFCSIPRIRGRQRSRPIADVLAEVWSLVAAGTREINLISQDTTFYGKDLDDNRPLLSSLLRSLQQLEGDFWVRLLYTHPAHWSDELIATIAACAKVCRYVDIPLQHINETVLEKMRRETSGQYIRDLIHKLRAGIPGVALRTTFIVGFPGETDEQFEELLEFIATARFERLGVFTYSQEDHTPAGNMPGQVPAKVKKQRHRRAMALQQKISRELNEGLVGHTIRVLVEKPATDGWMGRSQADAPEIDGSIHVRGTVKMGTFASVKITGAAEYDCTADAIEPAVAH